jgi:hypothetical protein
MDGVKLYKVGTTGSVEKSLHFDGEMTPVGRALRSGPIELLSRSNLSYSRTVSITFMK